MDRKVLSWVVIVLVALLQVGCATADNPPETNSADLTPVPGKEDDSHGWGENFKGM